MSRRIIPFFSAYEEKSKSSALQASNGRQLELISVALMNRSGAQIDLAILIKKSATTIFLAAEPSTVSLDEEIQAGSAVDVFTTTNNEGVVVSAKEKFNLIGLAISQAETGGPVYAFEYWDGGAWQALPDVIDTPSFAAAADTLLLFSSPRDWAVDDDGNYSIRMIATTAPGQAVQANELWVGKMLTFQPKVSDLSSLFIEFNTKFPLLLESGEALLPYFGQADAKNLVSAQYDTQG